VTGVVHHTEPIQQYTFTLHFCKLQNRLLHNETLYSRIPVRRHGT